MIAAGGFIPERRKKDEPAEEGRDLRQGFAPEFGSRAGTGTSFGGEIPHGKPFMPVRLMLWVSSTRVVRTNRDFDTILYHACKMCEIVPHHFSA